MKKLYTPVQTAVATFLGGPLILYYCMKNNYKVLGNKRGERKTNIYGFIGITAYLSLMPLLPENFPSIAILVSITAYAYTATKTYQMEGQDIVKSNLYDPKSNWNVFLVGALGLSITFAALLSIIYLYEFVGLTNA